MFFIAYAAISLIMRLFLGRLQDRNGDNLVVYSAVVIASGVVYLLVHGRSDNATAQAPEVILEAHEQQPAETPDMVVTDTPVSQEGVARTKDRGLDSE